MVICILVFGQMERALHVEQLLAPHSQVRRLLDHLQALEVRPLALRLRRRGQRGRTGVVFPKRWNFVARQEASRRGLGAATGQAIKPHAVLGRHRMRAMLRG